MDYGKLLDLATELGYHLAMCGAETYRIEESIKRIMQSYGVPAEVFAIPNCMHVTIEADNKPITRMRRIGEHGTDLDAVERYTGLSRRICKMKPTPEIGWKWLQETTEQRRYYKTPAMLAGFFSGCFFRCCFFRSCFFWVCAAVRRNFVGWLLRRIVRSGGVAGESAG